MKLSAHPVSKTIGFLALTVILLASSGRGAIAAEGDHGNPGQFMENIRKGLSGISKYFWSPKSDESGNQAAINPAVEAPDAAKPAIGNGKKPAPGKAIPQPKKAQAVKPVNNSSAASKSTKANSDKGSDKGDVNTELRAIAKHPRKTPPVVVSDGAKSNIKPLDRQSKVSEKAQIAEGAPGKAKDLNRDPKDSQTKNKTTANANKVEEALKAAMARNAVAKTQKPNKITAPKTQAPKNRAIAKVPEAARAPLAPAKGLKEKPPSKKHANIIRPGSIVKDKSLPNASAKTSEPHKSVVKTPAVKSTEQKKAATKQKAIKPSRALANAATGTSAVTGTRAVGQKTAKQHVESNKTGTYIWIPNIGSPLSQRFGRTGLSAHQLAANGELNRTDGRWVFAPNKGGQLPGLYGLSSAVHAADDGGVWIGGHRQWLYVFDKKRVYSSFVEGNKKKTAQKAADGKSDASKKSKVAKLNKAETAPQKTQKQANAVRGTAQKKSTSPTVKRSEKPSKQASVAPNKQVQKQRQAKAATKTARRGNWSKVNGRWVFVPTNQRGQATASNLSGLAEQVKKAPVTGGWVQRNNRWVYVAPQKGSSVTKATKAASAKKPERLQTNKSGKSVAKAQPQGKKRTGEQLKSGVTVVEKKPLKKSPQNQTASKVAGKVAGKKNIAGLAEGPQEAVKSAQGKNSKKTRQTAALKSKSTSDQKVWVRKNNRWVYGAGNTANSSRPVRSSGIATIKSGAMIKKPATVKPGVVMQAGPQANTLQKKQPGVKQASKIPSRQFMFFVPGPQPGTGNWYTAPLQILKNARKIQNPAYGAAR